MEIRNHSYKGAGMNKEGNSGSVMISQTAEEILMKKNSKSGFRVQENNEAIELAMKAANIAWWKMDLATGLVKFGKRKAEMLGWPAAKFKHYGDFMSLVHPDDYEPTMDAMRKHLDGSNVKYEAEYRILTKSHGYKWFSDYGAVAKKDRKGKPLLVAGLVVDISSRKMIEDSLKTSEIRYRRLFESAKDGILILDAETGMIMDVNPFLIEMLGYTEDQFLEKAIWEIGFFKDIVASKEKFSELQEQEYVRYDNLPLETANGKKINVEFVSNVYEENCRNVIQCNIRDITLRKKAETAHHQSEERFRLIMETSPEAIFILDHHGSFLHSNKALTVMLGYTDEEMKLKSFPDLMPKKEGIHFSGLFDEVLNKGKIFAQIELITKNGNHIVTELNSVLLPNGLVYNSCKDITLSRANESLLKEKSRQLNEQIREYRHLNKQLILSNEELNNARRKAEENDNLKTAFLQNMSHEIRTPMNGILGFSELLQNPHLSDEEQQQYIRIIEQSGLRMLNIINDIVNISKIETGQIELQIQETNVNDILRQLHTFFKPSSDARGLSLDWKPGLSDEQSLIKTDKTKLTQIMSNLIKNALKFTEEGTIEFGYHLKSRMLEFYVYDTGIGIMPSMHEIIFERFRQADISITRNYEGAGLGLTISKAFIEKLGGKIWMKSEAGKGTKFTFSIPYHLSRGAHPEIHDKKPSGGRLRNVNILITEDDTNSMLMLRKKLEIEKANLYFATNGQEALDIVKASPEIQIVLMDLKMPVMNGFEAIQLIKRIRPDLHIIAQSAYAFSNDQDKALESGCDDYMVKPIQMELLLLMINKQIKL